MIILLTGGNSFAIREYINQLTSKYDENAIDKRDGVDLSADNLPELLEGTSLFASQRLVILKEASANKQVWDALNDYLPRVSEDIELVLVEAMPDKRTKTYKTLQKLAKIRDFPELNEQQAREWVIEKIKASGQIILPSDATYLVDRVGIDQWRLYHEIDKLLILEDTTSERINEVVEATPHANVFALIDAALAGQTKSLVKQLKGLETESDPYKLFGLLASQVFQLALLGSDKAKAPEIIAKQIGIHPYPLKKLKPLAGRLSSREIQQIVEVVSKLDTQLKTSAAEPWLLIEQALLKIASLR